jgi:hypothetical protein
MAGDLNVKDLVWKSQVTNHSGRSLLDLPDKGEFQNSAPQRLRMEMVICSILWCIGIFAYQMSSSPTHWTQIICQSSSTSWTTLALETLRLLLKFTQTGSGFDA